MLVLVDTTVPLARLYPQPSLVEQSKKKEAEDFGSSSSEGDSAEEEQDSVQGTDFDSLGPVRDQIEWQEVLQQIQDSCSDGYWFILRPDFGADFSVH